MIPIQLQDPNLRFYLVRQNEKLPVEKRWTTLNNYCFFDEKLEEHVKSGGNYGVVTGFGGLIGFDFDDSEYHDSIKHLLPKTFTVRTASSRMFHYYYYLKGEMINKIGIDACPECKNVMSGSRCNTCHKKVDAVRYLDIQAANVGLVAPGSKIDRKFYEVYDDVPINDICYEQLQSLFHLGQRVRAETKLFLDVKKEDPVEVKKSVQLLKALNMIQTKEYHFQCPFHPMHGQGNLHVHEDGHLFCFHCRGWWADSTHFLRKFKERYPSFALEKMELVLE